MLNKRLVCACLVLAVEVNGEIDTIEGMAEHGDLHPLQENFWIMGLYNVAFVRKNSRSSKALLEKI